MNMITNMYIFENNPSRSGSDCDFSTCWTLSPSYYISSYRPRRPSLFDLELGATHSQSIGGPRWRGLPWLPLAPPRLLRCGGLPLLEVGRAFAHGALELRLERESFQMGPRHGLPTSDESRGARLIWLREDTPREIAERRRKLPIPPGSRG